MTTSLMTSVEFFKDQVIENRCKSEKLLPNKELFCTSVHFQVYKCASREYSLPKPRSRVPEVTPNSPKRGVYPKVIITKLKLDKPF